MLSLFFCHIFALQVYAFCSKYYNDSIKPISCRIVYLSQYEMCQLQYYYNSHLNQKPFHHLLFHYNLVNYTIINLWHSMYLICPISLQMHKPTCDNLQADRLHHSLIKVKLKVIMAKCLIIHIIKWRLHH